MNEQAGTRPCGGVDPVRAFDLSVQPGSRRLDVDMADPRVQHVVVEPRYELGPVVRLGHLDPEGQLLEHVVDEPDRRRLIEPVVDPKDPDPGAIVDRGELVCFLREPLSGPMNFTSICTRWPGSGFS